MTTEEKRGEFARICLTHNCDECPIQDACRAIVLHSNPAPTIDESQTAKADNGKPTYTLIPPAILDSIERVRAYGNAKYHDPNNWRQVEAQRYWEATLRHARAAWDDYTATDPESGLLHIEHMACNLAFLLQFISEGK